MPATALRHPETPVELFDSSDLEIQSERENATVFAPSARVAPASPSAPDSAPDIESDDDVSWRDFAPQVERFTGAPPEGERRKRRGLRKRHRHFVMSGVFLAGLVFFIELVGLVYLYSLDLSAVRYAASLDKQTQQTSLQLALAQNQLAASSSPAKLDAWAGQLGYHKAGLAEMDDVTSNAPLPVATPKAPVP